MAKAHPTQPIPPFPADVDRVAFGHWLAGFSDGEASFFLKTHTKGRCARFLISLRRDDRRALELIQSYWQCGCLRDTPNYSKKGGSPLALFDVSSVESLRTVVVPHFNRFPLFAKKRNDFLIWSAGVELAWGIKQRPKKRRGYKRGSHPKWTAEENDQFDSLRNQLITGRKYQSDVMPPP